VDGRTPVRDWQARAAGVVVEVIAEVAARA
jgi:hypothetical protein